MNVRMVKGQRRWPVGRGQAQGEDITGQDVDDDTEGRKEGSLPGKHGAGGGSQFTSTNSKQERKPHAVLVKTKTGPCTGEEKA